MAKDDLESEHVELSRRSVAGMLGSLGAVFGLGTLAACEGTAAAAGTTESIAQFATGNDLGWADAIGTTSAPLDLRTSAALTQSVVIVRGFWSPGDGGGGVFYWKAGDATPDDGGTVVASSGRTGGRWRRLVDGPFSVRWFGAKGDGTTSDSAAFRAALAAMPAFPSGHSLYVPPGEYKMTETLVLDRQLVLRGAALWASRLKFSAGLNGLEVAFGTTARGDGSLIENLAIVSAAGGAIGGTGHGIRMHAAARVERCLVRGFSENGVHIEASVLAAPPANANAWSLRTVRVDGCGGHGVYVSGNDANAGSATGVDCSDNGGWGFYDSSLLGNTYSACHASGNDLGAYKADGDVATNVFIGCYSESPGVSEIARPSLVLGGILSQSIAGDAGVISMQGGVLQFNNGAYAKGYATHADSVAEPRGAQVSARLGGLSVLNLYTQSAPGTGWTYTLEYGGQRPGWWSLRHQYGEYAFAFSTADATEEGAGRVWIHNDYYFGRYGTTRINIGIQAANTRPTSTGTPGQRILNARPQPGGYEGWVYVSPTVGWKGYGLVEL